MTEPSQKLVEEVLADARQKAERAQRRVAKEAAEVAQKLEAEGRQEAQAILAKAQASAKAARDQVLATVEIEVQRQRLHTLESQLQRIYDQVAAEAAKLDAGRVREALVRLALDGLPQFPPDLPVELALPESQHRTLGPQLVSDILAQAPQKLGRAIQLRLADRPASHSDGLVLRSADGRMEVVDSFAERLRRLWPDLRLQVAAILFPVEPQAKEK